MQKNLHKYNIKILQTLKYKVNYANLCNITSLFKTSF